MGIYFNPGNEGFRKAAKSEIYIDKTGLINVTNKLLNEEKNCISLSHARRFGKSQAAEMLESYYSRGCDSRELFSGFEISESENFETYLNKFNTIHLDISSFADDYRKDIVKEIKKQLLDEIKEVYPDVDYSVSIAAVLNKVYLKTFSDETPHGIKFVIIIDEWDCIVRNNADDPELVHEYLQFLHALFKSKESKAFLGFGYITGILPIKKIKDESALNNFTEYTMTESDELAPYFGFTEDEVRRLCEKYDMPFESVKLWYNGYVFDNYHMYNPNSVCSAMTKRKLRSYWKNTSAFDTINTFITLNFDGLKEAVVAMLNDQKISVNVSNFKNDLSLIYSKDDALTALIHLGYLGYDAERRQAFIPNYEVKTAFQSALETGVWKDIADTLSRCDDLMWATIDKDAEKVAEIIEKAHETYSSILKYNDENAMSCAITMAYFTAPAYYQVIRELPSGKGFADIVMLPRPEAGSKPAMIIELKYNKDADTAINQIKEKRYCGVLKGYKNEILLVGISYNKDKHHECVIESITPEW